jgi:hypothetical protein
VAPGTTGESELKTFTGRRIGLYDGVDPALLPCSPADKGSCSKNDAANLVDVENEDLECTGI